MQLCGGCLHLSAVIDRAASAGRMEPAALFQAKKAPWEAELGFADLARRDAQQALSRARTRDVKSMAAVALARAGDNTRAQVLADELEREFPEKSLVRLYWAATTRAAAELNRCNPERAITLLHVAEPVELSGYTIFSGTTLLPAYLRGEAYLRLHQGSAAAAEFRKFLDHRGMVANCPLAALARLGMARAYAQQGQIKQARTAYQDFLGLWKNADSDVPVLKQAKAEYDKLK